MAAEQYPYLEKRWLAPCQDWQQVRSLAAAAGISPEAAWICLNRGLQSPAQVQEFFYGGSDCFADPFLLPDMAAAVREILAAVALGKKILVYGDYDVDGITATSLLYLYLRRIGAHVDYYIPDRIEEGYGLNNEAIKWAARQGTALIITVDCGISAVEQVELANGLGIRMIITDHHLPRPELPPAAALVNAKIPGAAYPGADLAGVGVAWKLAQALECRRTGTAAAAAGLLTEYLDLVSLGTVADVVPVTGENRIIVKLGLLQINGTQIRPGITALLTAAGWNDKRVSESQLGFLLAPRLNAAGRLASASAGVELLIQEDPGRCREIAQQLDRENSQRQAVEKTIFQEAVQLLGDGEGAGLDRVLVLAAENWHPGVIGIVASRLMEKFHRPAILLAVDGDTAKGSGRSIPGFDLSRALEECRTILLQYGGHKQAAGLKIATGLIPELRLRLNGLAEKLLTEDALSPVLQIDVERGIDGTEEAIAADLARMAPFGQGNPTPVFALRDLTTDLIRWVGSDGAHLKLRLSAAGQSFEAIGFNQSGRCAWLLPGMRVDIACILEKNSWKGRESLQFLIRDIKPAAAASGLIWPGADGAGCLKEEAAALPSAIPVKGPTLVDARDGAGWHHLDTIPSPERQVLLYLRSPARQAELQAWLQGKKDDWRPLCCPPELLPWQQEGIISRVWAGEINLLIARSAVSSSGPGLFRHLLLFDCPPGPEEMLHLVGQLQETGTVHLCFPAGLEHSRTGAAGDHPNRDLLGSVFRAFRRVLQVDGQPMLRAGLIQRSRECGLASFPEHTLRAACQVFADLELIREEGSGEMLTVRLAEQPGEKVDLEDSAVFRAWQAKNMDSHRWQQLSGTPEFIAAVEKLWQ